MGRQAGAAGFAYPAGAIDLSDHALSRVRARFRHADELVAEHATEPHVTLNQLEIGLADTRPRHPDQHFVRRRVRGGPNRIHPDVVLFENDCAHLSASLVRNSWSDRFFYPE